MCVVLSALSLQGVPTLSVLPVLEFSAAIINTPTGRHDTTVVLSYVSERPDVFRLSISFSADEAASRVVHVHALRNALANPGELIDGCIMAVPDCETVIIYLSAGNGEYAMLYLDMQTAQSFVDTIDVEMIAEQAVDTVTHQGFEDLCKWLAYQ